MIAPQAAHRLTSPRVLLVIWSGVAVVAIAAAPLSAYLEFPVSFGFYGAFEALCHQQPQRSLQLLGFPLAVCARCWGVYWGALLAGCWGLKLGWKAVAAGAALVASTWAAEAGGFASPPHGVRLVTGFVLGGAVGGYLLALSAGRRCEASVGQLLLRSMSRPSGRPATRPS